MTRVGVGEQMRVSRLRDLWAKFEGEIEVLVDEEGEVIDLIEIEVEE